MGAGHACLIDCNCLFSFHLCHRLFKIIPSLPVLVLPLFQSSDYPELHLSFNLFILHGVRVCVYMYVCVFVFVWRGRGLFSNMGGAAFVK